MQDDKLFEIFEHIAWCIRSNLFEGDFQEKFQSYVIENFSWDKNDSVIVSKQVFDCITKRGICETFQEYISDVEVCKALVHAINIKD